MKKTKWTASPYLVWMVAFIAVPLAIVVYFAFTDKAGHFTLENIMGLGAYTTVFARSIVLAAIATAICLVLAFPVSYLLSRMRPASQRMMQMLIMLPMWMNFLLRTYAWMSLLEHNGIINRFLGLLGVGPFNMINTSGAVVLGMVYNYLPYMVLPLYTIMVKIDNSVIEAAQDLGANVYHVVAKVLVPLSMPGITTGITMVFVPSISTFIISRMLGGGSNLPIAVLIAFSFNESKSRTVFTGFTFKWYQNLFHNDMVLKSLGVSLGVAFAAACIATVVGTLAAIGISSMNKRARGAVMAVSYVPVVNPEIITGVSLMLLFVVFNRQVSAALSWLLQREVDFQGFGLCTLLIAHITFCLPYVIFNVSPKLRQLDPAVYDAALDLGCNPRQAFFKVVLPQLTPAILSAFLISLTYSIDDFIISYFTSGTMQTLPIAIYSMTKKKVSPEINALSAIMFVVILTIILAANAVDSAKERRLRRAARAEEGRR